MAAVTLTFIRLQICDYYWLIYQLFSIVCLMYKMWKFPFLGCFTYFLFVSGHESEVEPLLLLLCVLFSSVRRGLSSGAWHFSSVYLLAPVISTHNFPRCLTPDPPPPPPPRSPLWSHLPMIPRSPLQRSDVLCFWCPGGPGWFIMF